ncbi:hypothetical protein U14_02874 [Candidatus Moduliflexus flocculans]|uniref:Uncharacterized protein n=1 Tax=Candidatus Moduliflexus flocculans TaxID=1499966 RepID=A0A081BML3_9BACT|nr:hypothetical protein U14_02874 [Candidatus Moduliflexus flocculans]
MEPITTAIVAAVNVGLSKITEAGIIDLYNGVKNAIARRFGADSKLEKAIKNVEDDPESAGYKMNLDDQIVKAGADKDPDILDAVKQLLAAVEKLERQQPGKTGVTLRDIEAAASVIIRNITTPDGGVHAERIIAKTGNVEISDIHVQGGGQASPK